MNPPADIHEPLDLPYLWATMQDLEDGSLPEDRRELLMDLLNRSPAARRAYFEYFHQVAVLRMEAAKVEESGQFTGLQPLVSQLSWWRRPWMAAAAALALAAFIGALVFQRQARPSSMRMMAAEGTLWEINGDSRTTAANGTTLKQGDKLRVRSGVVKLELESGSTVIMQGPSRASFPNLRRPVLEDGWLWINTKGGRDSFEVATPGLLVRDIGTRFGVRVGGDGISEIHVLEGKVEVSSREDGGKPTQLIPDGKGHAIEADGSRTKVPLASDPFNMLDRILTGQGSYRNTILSQNPSGYWKFDEDVAKWADNEMHGRNMARCGLAVTSHAEAADGEDCLAGFGRSNKSVYLPARSSRYRDGSLVAMLDGGEGVSRKQGAVTFWIRRASSNMESQSLWLAGTVNANVTFPAESLAQCYLTASGQPAFFMANGNEKVVLIPDRTVSDSRWHHIGVSWGSSGNELYLDGERIARRSDVPLLDDWTTYGNFLRFGKPSDYDFNKGMRNFHGWLDEFAVWNRPLTPEEVRQQYKAARGNKND